MTDVSRQALPADSEPRLRETLRATLDGARAQLAANLAQLRSAIHADSNLIAQGDAQLSALIALQGQLDTANPLALAMLNAAITASVANASTLAQQVNDAVTATTREAAIQQLAAADTAARDAVTSVASDMYEKRIFENDLHFTSKEDEEAYRRRAAEYERYIRDQAAKGTPQGDLNAAGAMRRQMLDAGAHGAAANPQWQRDMTELNSTITHLHAAMAATGQSTAEFDRDNRDASPTITSQRNQPAPASDPTLPSDMASVAAALKMAGVQTSPVANPQDDGHGLATAEQPARASRVLT